MQLTEKQKAFAREYVKDFNGTQAAIRAGYSKKRADQTGSRTLGNVEVQCLIQEAIQRQVDKSEVKVADMTVGDRHVVAEVADTSTKRSWGLQGREGLEPDTGMLFVFRRASRLGFVMKEVSFPLSIAFFNEEGTILGLYEMRPGDRKPARPPAPARFALEMEAGWFDAAGVRPGDKIGFAEEPQRTK